MNQRTNDVPLGLHIVNRIDKHLHAKQGGRAHVASPSCLKTRVAVARLRLFSDYDDTVLVDHNVASPGRETARAAAPCRAEEESESQREPGAPDRHHCIPGAASN